MKNLDNMSKLELILEVQALRKKLEEKQEFVDFLIKRVESILQFGSDEVNNNVK